MFVLCSPLTSVRWDYQQLTSDIDVVGDKLTINVQSFIVKILFDYNFANDNKAVYYRQRYTEFVIYVHLQENRIDLAGRTE